MLNALHLNVNCICGADVASALPLAAAAGRC